MFWSKRSLPLRLDDLLSLLVKEWEELDFHQVEKNLVHVFKISACLPRRGIMWKENLKNWIIGSKRLIILDSLWDLSSDSSNRQGGWERFVYFAEAILLVIWRQYRCWDYRLYHCDPDGPLAAFPISNRIQPARCRRKFNPGWIGKPSIPGKDLDNLTKLFWRDVGPLQGKKASKHLQPFFLSWFRCYAGLMSKRSAV